MFNNKYVGFILLILLSFSTHLASESVLDKKTALELINSVTDIKTNLGEALTSAEIEKYSITIFPDGKNLPTGKGSVLQGKELYKNRCMMCHGDDGDEGPAARLTGSDGWFSFSDPLRVIRIKKYPVLLISVCSLWPYSTTLFDYIRRAMPHYSPKNLTNNEVYALTAYILYMHDLIDKKTVLDKKTILEVTMPGNERSVSDWQ